MGEILKERIVKIRKPRKCFGCLREFKVGERLKKLDEVDADGFIHTYWCDVCQEYCNEMLEYDDLIGEGELRSEDPYTWEEIRYDIEG